MENLETDENMVNIEETFEDENIDKLLKSSVGGFTKKSVIEYIEALKRQYCNAGSNLNENLQALAEENEKLKEKLNKLENDNKVLADKVVLGAVETYDSKTGDIASYKAMIKALQQDVKELENKLFKSTVENNSLVERSDEKEKELLQKEHELQLLQEIIAAEKKETESKEEESSDLSSTVSKLNEELLYYKEIVSTGKVSELNTRIDELTAMVEAQNSIVEKRSQEIQTKDITLETLTAQNEVLNKTVTTLTQNIDSIMVQNEKLSALNKVITQKLEEAQKDTVEEIAEKTDIYIEKLILARKLDEAQLKLNLYNEKASSNIEKSVIKYDEIKSK